MRKAARARPFRLPYFSALKRLRFKALK